jgi:outer membrane protein TolC
VVQTPSAFRDLQQNSQLQAQIASYADLPWWQVFQDPKLQDLIRTALKQNYDLQLATERIIAARAQLAVTRSGLFPQVQGNGVFAGGKDPVTRTKYNLLTLATLDSRRTPYLVARHRFQQALDAHNAEETPSEQPNIWFSLPLRPNHASVSHGSPFCR